MNTTWWVILGLAVTTFGLKAVGPVVLGGHAPSPVFVRVISTMAPALLAALVVTSAFADGRHLTIGADTVGVAAGGVLLWRGHNIVLAAVAAVFTTAALRAIF